MQRYAHSLYIVACWVLVFPVLFSTCILARFWRTVTLRRSRPRLLWAGAPMPSLATASQAMSAAGYDSCTIVTQRTGNNTAGQFDVMLARRNKTVRGFNTPLYILRCSLAFMGALFSRDILHSFFNGGILGHTPLLRAENFLWRMAGGKRVFFAYGQDGFVYRDLPDSAWARALQSTYPRKRAQDEAFARRITALSNTADAVVGCIVHTATLPRVDVWPVLWYPAPNLPPAPRRAKGEGLHIAHPSNHRAIKGSDALIAAVDRLQKRGLNITLDVIEGVDIEASRERLSAADIIVDQLLMGYAMTALEGLALGKLVISGFDDGPLYASFYERSYLSDCPIVQASPETIESKLEQLYHSPERREQLRAEGQAYLRRHHTPAACVDLFTAIYRKIWDGEDVDLGAFYGPNNNES